MSYATCKAALITQLAAQVPALAGHIEGNEPTNIEGVSAYVLLRGFRRSEVAGKVAMIYQAAVRLAVPVGTDLAAAEAQLDPYVNAIPAAISADRHLGGALPDGLALCGDGSAGFWTVNGAQYRHCDFTVELTEKGPDGSGL